MYSWDFAFMTISLNVFNFTGLTSPLHLKIAVYLVLRLNRLNFSSPRLFFRLSKILSIKKSISENQILKTLPKVINCVIPEFQYFI